MKNSDKIKKLVFTALCTALCVVLPLAFHMIQNAGAIFCPMHIPVLLCGLLCGWPYGLLCGALGPLLSFLLTSMPPAAILPAMLLELAVYGAASGLLVGSLRIKSRCARLYLSLVCSMLLGRIVSGAAKALIFQAGSYSFSVWIGASFITCLPGIAIQLVLIPALVLALSKARLAPLNGPGATRSPES